MTTELPPFEPVADEGAGKEALPVVPRDQDLLALLVDQKPLPVVELRAVVAEALRSDRYERISGRFRAGSRPDERKRCCAIGVAIDTLLPEMGWVLPEDDTNYRIPAATISTALIPISDHLEIPAAQLIADVLQIRAPDVYNDNDDGADWDHIANLLESGEYDRFPHHPG